MRTVRDSITADTLKDTTMPAGLGGTGFIDNDNDAALLTNNADDFARAIARGITDFEGR